MHSLTLLSIDNPPTTITCNIDYKFPFPFSLSLSSSDTISDSVHLNLLQALVNPAKYRLLYSPLYLFPPVLLALVFTFV